MVLGQIFRTLGRRWYLVVVGLALTAGLTWFAANSTPPIYRASGTVLLMPSKEQLSRGGANPFLLLGDLETPASIVIARLNSDTEAAVIGELAPSASYSVDFDDSLRGPAIKVSASDENPDAALSVMRKLLTEVPRELSALQLERNVPAAATVGTMPLVADSRAQASSGNTLRSAITGAGAGLVFTGLLVFAVDGLVNRRRQRKRAVLANVADPDDPDEPDAGAPASQDGTKAVPGSGPTARHALPADPGDGTDPTGPALDASAAEADADAADAAGAAAEVEDGDAAGHGNEADDARAVDAADASVAGAGPAGAGPVASAGSAAAGAVAGAGSAGAASAGADGPAAAGPVAGADGPAAAGPVVAAASDAAATEPSPEAEPPEAGASKPGPGAKTGRAGAQRAADSEVPGDGFDVGEAADPPGRATAGRASVGSRRTG